MTFDPYAWIARAIAAGYDPSVIYRLNGRKVVYCNNHGVDRAKRPAIPNGRDFELICEVLIAMGRVARQQPARSAQGGPRRSLRPKPTK